VNDGRAQTDDESDKVGDTNDPTDVKFAIGQQLTDEQTKQIHALLTEYLDVFDPNPGLTDLVTHHIQLVDEMPCWQASYPIPESMRDEVENELRRLERNGIIEEDNETKFNSPLMVIRKPTGGLRLVNNFVKLNEKTVKERYDMKNAHELIYRVAGAKYISRIDLNSFYFQLNLAPECRHYTGFNTPWGSFHYNVLAQGLCGAPMTAQRLIDRVMRGSHKFSAGLMDDLVVFSTSWNDHLVHVRDVLERLRNAGLTANVAKCIFSANSIKILGFWIKDGKICLDDGKVEAVKNWKLPRNKTQLKSYLGFLNFFHHFLENYATLAAPLTDMLARKKPDKLVWTQKERDAFESLKLALLKKPILRPPDPTKPMKVFTDANSVAVAGILAQYDEEAQSNYVIAYASRKLLPQERNYSTIEAETLAVVFAVQKFRQWIFGREILVYTDHRPLQWIGSLMKHNSRIARWALILQDYDIKTTYIKGENQIADALTRTPNMYE